MGYKGEPQSNLSQTSILKEGTYIEFFLNCRRASSNIQNGLHIRQRFVNYMSFLQKCSSQQWSEILPNHVYGIDSSHIEQPLDSNTGHTRRFLSELMLISTVSEVDIDMAKLKLVNQQYLSTGTFAPQALVQASNALSFNFWYNGANLTPQNIADENKQNPKNGFKVACRDALKKPDAEMHNPNVSAGVVKGRKVSNQAKEHKWQDFRLLDAFYEIMRNIKNDTEQFNKNIPDFDLLPYLGDSTFITSTNAPYCLLKPTRCPNKSCTDRVAIAHVVESLDQYSAEEMFCPICHTAICEWDSIGLTEQFESEMSNLGLLSDLTYVLEHLRATQRLLCLPPSPHNTAIIMDGTLGLFRKLQALTPGIKSIVESTLNHGSTVFGVVKHSETKDFFDYLDHPLDPTQQIPCGSFWLVRNTERYKYISPRFHAKDPHGSHTHYGVDVMVKTSKGYRFLVSVALPASIQDDTGLEYGSDGYLDYVEHNFQSIPSFVKMLATLEKVQMLLYGGSTIPQTLTHGQASISWNVSGRILAQAIVNERVKNNKPQGEKNERQRGQKQ